MMYDKTTRKKHILRRLAAGALALCMTLALLPALTPAADAAVGDAMNQLVDWGVVGGYPDGNLHPERSLTRAEFVAMVNRAYGYRQTGETPFIDVPVNAWFHDDIGIAYNAKYFGGVSPRMAAPDQPLTREMAMVLLARNMRLDPVAGEVTEFSDGRDFSDWSRGYARAARQIGLIGGYDDGSYKPKNNINRGEMATMLQRALGTLVNTAGVHTLGDVYGNVTINTPNATLKDTTVAGDLYITGGLDLGDITLDNVRVLGDIIVAGGGESQNGENSVILRNVEADSLLVDSIADQFVSISAEGNTSIAETLLRSDAYVQDRTRPGQGLLNISLESIDPAASFTLSGNLETVVNKTPNSTLNIAMGTVDALTVDERATNSTLNLDINSTVETLNLDVATNVTGVGDIDDLYVNSSGSVVSMLPDTITIRPGLTASIAGETMNAVQAQESSADPRLLAGYPKMKNVAPTSATALFSANKSGTVYWAVSTTTDGSIGEEELISPTEGNTAALRSGATAITASNTETSAGVTVLTPDGNYYVAAVMVDARDRHSPVKVAAFTTPDNTTPAFNTGYPVVSQNDYTTGSDGKNVYHIQVSAMPNKTCSLYYALYPAGSSAPTAQQFRVGALGQPLQSGVDDASKNVISFLEFGGLSELTTYDLYLCLIDADGARNSAVRKLTVTTVDGTPPVLQYNTPEVNQIAATSLRLRVNLNEAGTFYWVAVKSGTDYLKAPGNAAKSSTGAVLKNDANKALFKEYFQRQIENGVNAARSGSATLRADTDVNVNITGLERETSYDIYYIAKDSAGNYSEITLTEVSDGWNMTSNMLTESTLDTSGPTVAQEFTHLDTAAAGLIPYADTTIRLIFSENVRRADAADTSDETLLTYLRGNGYSPDALATFLNSIVKLQYFNTNTNRFTDVLQRTSSSESGADWVIDWRNAVVTRSTTDNTVTVTLATSSDLSQSALRLKSGETYRFEFDNVTDNSSARNPMLNTPIDLPEFTTVISQIGLNAADLATIPVTGNERYRVDAAFTMTPVSTNTAESVNWDMLIWADRTVSFEVYSYNSSTDTWKKEGSAGITVDGNMAAGSYAGISFRRAVQGQSDSYPKLSDLTESQYRYAIHITALDNASEATSYSNWSGTVNMKVSIVTGTFNSLRNLNNTGITEANFEQRLTTSNVADLIRDIGNPRPFILPITFEDTTYPVFDTGYPRFVEATDTGVNIIVRLTGTGTLYYLMVPAETVNGVSTSGIRTQLVHPNTVSGVISGEGSETSINEDTVPSSAWYLGWTESNPSNDQIHSARSYYRSETYKIGTPMTVGTDAQSITRNDLLSDTRYFVYFVTRGAGGRYSPVYVYTFKTPKASAPIITVRQGSNTSNVDVSVNADTMLTYIVVPYNSAINNELLSSSFTAQGYPTVTNVLQAIITPTYSGNGTTPDGSVFDKFATDDQKRQVERYISNTQSAASSNSIASALDVNVTATNPLNVDPGGSMVGSTRYVFLTVGHRTLSTSASEVAGYAFAGYYPMIRSDTTPPIVTAIGDGSLQWTDANPLDPTVVPSHMSGTITLSFGEDLYYYNTDQSVKKLIDLGPRTSSTRKTSDFISVEELVQGSSSNYIRATPIGYSASEMATWEASVVNRSTQVIEIYVNNAGIGQTLSFSARMLGDASNNVSDDALIVTLNYRTVNGVREPWVQITRSWNGTGDTSRSSTR